MDETFINSRNVNSNNINSNNILVYNFNKFDDEKAQILVWLSSLESKSRHRDVRSRRVEGVGNWLLQTEEFLHWRKGTSANSALICYGDPGVGKTYIRRETSSLRRG